MACVCVTPGRLCVCVRQPKETALPMSALLVSLISPFPYSLARRQKDITKDMVILIRILGEVTKGIVWDLGMRQG